MAKYLFTSESVTEGHPDKICDRISDGVLDAILAQDKNARVACETCATTGMVLIMGEITTTANVDIPAIARDVIKETGYDNSDYGFDYKTCAILTTLDKQSPDIAMGVDNALEGRDNNEFDTGAGDQGMMFGYACDETEELMPLTISLAHALSKKLTAVRKSGEIPYLLPDGKTAAGDAWSYDLGENWPNEVGQGAKGTSGVISTVHVTVEYNEDGTPSRIDTVVVSSQHKADVTQEQLRADIIEKVIKTTVPASLLDENTKMLINPTGRFVVGGPQGDSGLTGRKIIVDTYGGVGRHGGGAFSGKDPTKVDRSAAYAARHVAKNIVAAGIAKRCEVELAYAIGVAQPVSVFVDTFGTGVKPDSEISAAVSKVFDLRPSAIISSLNLRNTKYRPLAAYGHKAVTEHRNGFIFAKFQHILPPSSEVTQFSAIQISKI